jgi:predicted AlkP superfamily pyrophosphatase or phosphodiesterase
MAGWYMYMKEFNGTIIPLHYITKTNLAPLGKIVDIKKVFNINPITKKIKTKSYLVQNNKILNSNFTHATSEKSKKVGFNKMEGYFRAIKEIINSNNQKKYIYAYYSDHDSLCHKNGSNSKKVLDHFKKLNKRMETFINSLKGTNTTLIITADHGMIDTTKNKLVNMRNHPKLKETLSMPLCGEHRFAYCYVKPSREKDFLKYIKTKFKKYCEVHKSEDLIKKKYFGLFNPHKNFKDRIGDYTLIMKDNYSIYDNSSYQKKEHFHIGEHGGLSKEELYVPLIVIKK